MRGGAALLSIPLNCTALRNKYFTDTVGHL